MSKERLSHMQKCFLVLMLKLENFKADYKQHKEKLTNINKEVFISLFKGKEKEFLSKGKCSWKERKRIDKENLRRINFGLVLKECPNKTLEKSTRRSLDNLEKKGMIKIKKQGYNIKDYVLTPKGREKAKSLL